MSAHTVAVRFSDGSKGLFRVGQVADHHHALQIVNEQLTEAATVLICVMRRPVELT